jgi:CTP synthase (UTP-ammonia lyase)
MVTIGIIGDYDATRETHRATVPAVEHAGLALGVGVAATWIPTERVESEAIGILHSFDGLVIAPGSPYQSLTGALSAIEHARVRDVPLLGTCGGFQHVVLEFARNVLGFDDAQHAEYDPYASTLFITPLSCSLAGQTMIVHLRDGTKAALAYGTRTTKERYYCNFGLNPDYVQAITDSGLLVSGVDQHDEERIVELSDHPFFLASLFVPQTSSAANAPHPLFSALVAAAAEG